MSWKKFIFASDIHGDKQDPTSIQALSKFSNLWKPEYRVCGGDLWDFRPLRKGGSEEERRESMRADFEAGSQWLADFQATHFLRGNHDERLYDLASHGTGALKDYALHGLGEIEKLVKSLHCKMLPYDRRAGVLRLGKLKMLHGYCTGVNAARKMCQVYGACLFGHAHGIQVASIEGIENRVARMVGCLCDLDMFFMRASMGSLVHRHGWAFGVINDKSGEYYVWQAEEVNGKWLVPSDVVEL